METEESKNEVKEDTTESKESKKELRQKLRQQMEFYFSDSNLTKDRFLKKEVTNSADGCKIFVRSFYLNKTTFVFY